MGETIKELELVDFSYIPSGNVDYPRIQTSFSDIEDKINEIIQEMQRVEDRHYTTIRSVLVEDEKPVKLMEARDHKHSQLKKVWIAAADNLELDQTIWLRVKGKNIAYKKTIKSTEKAGKTQLMKLNPFYIVNRFEDVDVVPNSARKVLVSAIVEEV